MIYGDEIQTLYMDMWRAKREFERQAADVFGHDRQAMRTTVRAYADSLERLARALEEQAPEPKERA